MKEHFTISQAAAMLGLHRGSLWRIMKELGISYTVPRLNKRHHLISAQDVLIIKGELDRLNAILSAPEVQESPPPASVVVQAVPAIPERPVSLSSYCIRHGIPYWTAENYVAKQALPLVLDHRGKKCLDAEGRATFDQLFSMHPRWKP